jgi:hypothetical protein
VTDMRYHVQYQVVTTQLHDARCVTEPSEPPRRWVISDLGRTWWSLVIIYVVVCNIRSFGRDFTTHFAVQTSGTPHFCTCQRPFPRGLFVKPKSPLFSLARGPFPRSPKKLCFFTFPRPFPEGPFWVFWVFCSRSNRGGLFDYPRKRNNNHPLDDRHMTGDKITRVERDLAMVKNSPKRAVSRDVAPDRPSPPLR